MYPGVICSAVHAATRCTFAITTLQPGSNLKTLAYEGGEKRGSLHPDVSLAVQAKREVGMLYEDITKPPYTAIFNKSTTARALWEAVTVLRTAEAALTSEQQRRNGKEQLIAIHGNRFVLHLVFQQLQQDSANNNAALDLENHIREMIKRMLDGTIRNVLDHYPTAYPASLFKNATKCRDLAKRILAPPVPAGA
jgi:hypothetical protein